MDDAIMPALFIGYGNPMNAIEDNEFSRLWKEAARQIPKPVAILCISAHWETQGTQVTAMEAPRTLHDSYGFPRPLFEKQYPAPGSPALAARIVELVGESKVLPDHSWGLDHGTWSVLCRMYPQALVPVVQLSLDRTQEAVGHYALGQQLKQLRSEGVLIVGSGNIVHNLRMMAWEDTAYDWAVEYDAKVAGWILQHDHDPIIHYEKHGRSAMLSVNSAEHYLPLLYVLGVGGMEEPISFFAYKLSRCSLFM